MNKKDIFGNVPKIGDIIVYNPPKYKGLIYGTCIGFTQAGCPKINKLNYVNNNQTHDYVENGFLSVKADFVIK